MTRSDSKTTDRTSSCAGGEHTLHLRDSGLFSSGACGLGWCRRHPLNDALFSLRQVRLVGDEGSDASGESDQSEPCGLFYASYYHNLAVGARSGRLYSWGCGTFTDGGLDGVIPALGQGREATDLGQQPSVVDLPTKAGERIVQLSGGAYHSIVLTGSNRLFTFGAGQLGQLGRPARDIDSSGLPVDPRPAEVEGMPGLETIASVGSGFYNTFAACESGALYCAGENQNMQCGSGPRNLREMTRVEEVKEVESAWGGYCHTLIKSVAGEVLSMGCGEEGQRGIGRPRGDEDDEEPILPVVSPIPLPVKARQVAAGANHSVVLGEDGVAYTFGANDVGQCGVSVDEEDEDGGGPVWSPTPVLVPGKVAEVSAGYAHTVLTTVDGRVFAFGQNDNGQLGIGESSNSGGDVRPSLTLVEVKFDCNTSRS